MEKITFKEWANIWLENYKRGTVKGNTFKQTYQDVFRIHLFPKFGDMALDELTKKDVSEYLNSLSSKYSKSVLQKIRICILGMYSTAIEEGLCNINPAKNVKVKSLVEKKNKHIYSPQESKMLFEYAAHHPYGLGICIMLESGLRCSEMLGLKWDDIDFHNRYLNVKRSSVTINCKAFVSTPKSVTSIRILPISAELCEVLKLEYFKKTSEFIVPRPSGKPYCPVDYLRYRYNPFMRDATADLGIPRLTSHELRHTRGTILYTASGDIYAVSKYLGHASVETTAKYYVHTSPEVLRKRLGI